MHRHLALSLLAGLLWPNIMQAQSPELSLLRDCESRITAKWKQWKLATVPKEVAEYASTRQENPTIVYGDFDGDRRGDVALLIQVGASPSPDYPERLNSLHIAVCLNAPGGLMLHLIDKPYCGDGIALRAKGTAYYDHETEQRGVYQNDGIHAYCFEKAGATYQFGGGTFRRIVDSD